MCDKAVNICPFVSDSVPNRYMMQMLSNKIFSLDFFMLKYCPDKYNIQKNVLQVRWFLTAISKFVPDWFIANKMTEKLECAVLSNDYIFFGDLDSDFITFFSEDIGLKSITLDNINLHDKYFDHSDPD